MTGDEAGRRAWRALHGPSHEAPPDFLAGYRAGLQGAYANNCGTCGAEVEHLAACIGHDGRNCSPCEEALHAAPVGGTR